MEVMQGKILKRILGLPTATPYWGLLFEMDIWPVKMEIIYRKLMLFHNLANSDNERTASTITIEQERLSMTNCWFSEVQREGNLIGMEVNSKRAKEKKKSEWKKECKKLIAREVTKKENEHIQKMEKLRFLGTERGRHTYMKETHNDETRRALRIRLNMEPYIKNNFGMKGSCSSCGLNDTTEHILTCDKTKNENVTVDDLKKGQNMKEIVNIFKRAEEMRSQEITDSVYAEIDAHLQTASEEVENETRTC